MIETQAQLQVIARASELLELEHFHAAEARRQLGDQLAHLAYQIQPFHLRQLPPRQRLMHAQQLRGCMARGFVQHRGVEQQGAVLGAQAHRATIDGLVALGGRALGMHEAHLTRAEVIFGQRSEQSDHRTGQHLREMSRCIGLHAQSQHGHFAIHYQTCAEGIGEQAHVAQGMAQAGTEGFAGEKQIFQQQAVKRRQVLGQVQADMFLAAFFAGGLPERRLRRMGETAGRQPAGRQANVDGLGLELAGIEYTPRGVKTDARLRTTNRRVHAVGDVAGGPQFTHIAGYHAGIVIRNALFRLPAKVDYSALPWVTYTEPELAHVGMTEAQARQSHGDVRVLTWGFEENDRAQAERDTEGKVKVLTLPNGRILGASIVGAHAGELIQVWCLAISQKLKIGAVASMIAPYPTLGEAGKRAAGSFYTPKLFSGRTRGLVRFLGRFG